MRYFVTRCWCSNEDERVYALISVSSAVEKNILAMRKIIVTNKKLKIEEIVASDSSALFFSNARDLMEQGWLRVWDGENVTEISKADYDVALPFAEENFYPSSVELAVSSSKVVWKGQNSHSLAQVETGSIRIGK